MKRRRLDPTVEKSLAAWLALNTRNVPVVHRDLYIQLVRDWAMTDATEEDLRLSLVDAGVPVAFPIGQAAIYCVFAFEEFERDGLLRDAPPAVAQWYAANMQQLVERSIVAIDTEELRKTVEEMQKAE